MKFWLSNEDETRRAGAALAAVLLPLASSMPVVVFVRGNLGAGKSTFARGFLSRAGVTGVMPSPTYSLVEPYQTDTLNVFHMDAYRIADGAELDYLGLDDMEQPGSILIVEWPDHVRHELPAPTATVDLEISAHPDRHSPAQSPAQDRHNDPTSPAQDSPAQDRHNDPTRTGHAVQQAVQDRHNPAKFVDQAVQDRHNSAKSVDQAVQQAIQDRHNSALDRHNSAAQDRHNSAAQDRHNSAKSLGHGPALDSHLFDFGQAEQAKDQAEGGCSAGFDAEMDRERQKAPEVGRLLSVTLGAVRVQIEQRLISSGDWQGLFRVVT